MSDDIPLPSIEEIQQQWKRPNVLAYLRSKQEELDLDDEDIQIIEKKKVSGDDFLDLNTEELMKYGLEDGPAKRIVKLVKKIKGEGQ
ncbi:7288_t:CDS:1, partial [Gigaspora margarita]